MCPIFKKGSRSHCTNYRGISVLNVACKIFLKEVTGWLGLLVETILKDQSGFRVSRSCIDNIFILQQIIEKNKNLMRKHICCMWIMICYGFWCGTKKVSVGYLNKKRNPESSDDGSGECMYRSSWTYIAGNYRKWEIINKDLWQGCSLTPRLFNLYLICVICI